MQSATEPIASGQSPKLHRLRVGFKSWNRRLHFYAGLFLLVFTWLFALSGLLLNHPSWSFAEFWKNRRQTKYEREITIPGPEVKGDLGQAREILKQLEIRGEILWTTTRTNANQFDFQVRRPGHFFFINADLVHKRVSVQQSDVNLWGVIKVLHTFTGVQMDDARNTRDWRLTSLWVLSMDAVAAGLIFMVLSSLYMWLELRPKRLPGAIVLGLGILSCGLFCIGLRWLF
jgi:hypothetical protein